MPAGHRRVVDELNAAGPAFVFFFWLAVRGETPVSVKQVSRQSTRAYVVLERLSPVVPQPGRRGSGLAAAHRSNRGRSRSILKSFPHCLNRCPVFGMYAVCTHDLRRKETTY